MHSTSVLTSMLAVLKLVKILFSGNMHGKCSTCVVHQFLEQKVVVSTEERSFGMKSMDYYMIIWMYVAQVMHEMHYSSVATAMLAVFMPLKTLISANLHWMHATGVAYRHLKRKVAVKHIKTKFLLEKYGFSHVYVTECCSNIAQNAFQKCSYMDVSSN